MNALECVSFLLWLAPAVVIAQSQTQVTKAVDPAACGRLAQLAIPSVTIGTAQVVAAGAFEGPPAVFTGKDLSAFYKGLPAFCRVVARAHPTSDSNITIEVWLPASGWNGKLQGLGNGGFAGLLDYEAMGGAMSRGYTAAVTDAGHEGGPTDATWALGHPEKIVDFGHRGIHEMTRVAKEAIRALYGGGPRRSYFAGCSDGGREALMEAQRYPADYDGILAGAPAHDWTHLLASAIWNSRALMLDPGSFVPPEKIPVLAAAVLAACDQMDGVRDGVLNDPRQCRFEPARLVCKSDDSGECLSRAQAAALEKIYGGPRDSRGRQVFPPYLPGAEDGRGGWGTWITGPAPGRSLMFAFGNGYFSNMVYDKADWDFRTFDLERALEAAEAKTAQALNATDPDLAPFASHGGKLILYHGWDDPAIPALSTVQYFDDVVARMGRSKVDSFARLFMVPGMQHCDGGPGPHSFGQGAAPLFPDARRNVRAALERWVENGSAPADVIASLNAPDSSSPRPLVTRPLCPQPQSAKYKGSGDVNDASSFTCVSGPDR